MSLKDIQHYFEKLCHTENFDGDIKKLCPQLPKDLINHLQTQSMAKKKVYPRLIFENTYNVCRASMPYTFEYLGEEKIRKIIYDFYQNQKVITHYYRIIPLEFLAFLKNYQPDPFNTHPYLLELADYEVLEFDLIYRTNHQPRLSNPDVLLEKAKIILNPIMELKKYHYPVHKISKKNLDQNLAKNKTDLCMYRNPDNQEVYTLILSSIEFDFLTLINTDQKDDFSNLTKKLLNKNKSLEINEILVILQKMLSGKIIEALV